MKYSTKIKSLFAVLIFALSISGQNADSIFKLSAGTKIYARMDNEINSKVSSVNDTFTLTVSQAVVIRGTEVLPVGTVLEGRIIKVKRASSAGENGYFEIKFENLKLPDGTKRQIEAEAENIEKIEKFQTKRNLLTIAGSATLGALAGTLIKSQKGALTGAGIGAGLGTGAALLQKGNEQRIKAGEELVIRLTKEVLLPPKDY